MWAGVVNFLARSDPKNLTCKNIRFSEVDFIRKNKAVVMTPINASQIPFFQDKTEKKVILQQNGFSVFFLVSGPFIQNPQ